MAKHTPGPWELIQESADPEWHIITAARGRIMANIHIEHGNQMDQANARLITASPTMFAAIDKALMYFGNVNTCEWEDVLEALVDARAAASDEFDVEELRGQMDGAAAFAPDDLMGGVFDHEELVSTLKMSHYYYNAFRESTPKGPTEIDDIAFIKATIDKFSGKQVDPA